MKRFLLLSLIATNAFSHGMYPTGNLKPEYVYSNIIPVKFNLKNTYNSRKCYDVEINNQIMTPYTTCLNGGEIKNMTVYVSAKLNQWSVNQVCSLSPLSGTSRTRMCLKSQSYYFR